MKTTRLAVPLSYSLASFFNFALSLVVLLIPLYGLHLGLSLPTIGILISIPGFLQLGLRLVAGALIDNWGEKPGLLVTFLFGAAAAIFFMLAHGFYLLALAQVSMGLARSFFWTSSQSYASRIPGTESVHILGRTTSFVHVGRILGIIVGGVLIDFFGYRQAFGSMLFMLLLGFILAGMLPSLPKKNTSLRVSLQEMPNLVKQKSLQMAAIVCFLTAIAFVLTEGFYPVWFHGLGFSETAIGLLMAARGIGSILSTFSFGYLAHLFKEERLFQIAILLPGVLLISLPFIKAAAVIVVVVMAAGILTGVGQVLYISMTSFYSSEEYRGMALSLVGMAWSSAYILGPIPFSRVADRLGVPTSFLLLGIIYILMGSIAPAVYRRFIPRQVMEEGSN